MRKFIPLLLFLSLLFPQQQPDSVGFYVKVGDPSPNFTLALTNGDTISLSALGGKVIMLQFTASWCSVCRREMPYIEQLIWQDLQCDDLIVIGVDRDEPLEKVLRFVEDMEITYPMALDPGAEIFGLFADKNSGVTRNVIISKNGKIIHLTRLFQMNDFLEMVEVIKQALKQDDG